jgi:DNA processing protein
MDLSYWLMLLKAPGLGLQTLYKALKFFENPEKIFLASKTELKECKLFDKKTIDFLKNPDFDLIKQDIDWSKKDYCHIITLIDEKYPEQLKKIYDPPPLLYVRGDLDCISLPQIAIIGSRNPSPSGSKNAYEFAKLLSKSGLAITSGMASGIDSNAHIGALKANCPTIAVCGTGLDRIYPARNKSLAHEIVSKGALVSEFTIGTPPLAKNFPKRNRVISGLSIGTLVVEAGLKSGTMITAKSAMEQGREVFAIPSSIHNPMSKGCHKLIKQGAKLVDNITDIIEELNINLDPNISQHKQSKKDINKNVDYDHNLVLKYIGYEAVTVDEIVEKSGLSPQIINQTLIFLELDDKIIKINGNGYLLK